MIEAEERETHSTLRFVVLFCMMSGLLLWSLFLISKDVFLALVPTLVGPYCTEYSQIPVQSWGLAFAVLVPILLALLAVIAAFLKELLS